MDENCTLAFKKLTLLSKRGSLLGNEEMDLGGYLRFFELEY
jgi:hypothetical protein